MEKVSYQNIEINRWDVGSVDFFGITGKGARLLNWHINMSDGSVRDVIHWPENNAEPLAPRSSRWHSNLISICRGLLARRQRKPLEVPDGVVRQMPMHGLPAIPSLSFVP